MTLSEFEKQLNEIRAANGWTVIIECCGVFLVTICDKESGGRLWQTGSTSLEGILQAMQPEYINSPIWRNCP
jgi:hypothetical protein